MKSKLEKKAFEYEQKKYLECESVWYFRIEYHLEFGGVHYVYFDSIREAEYWARTADREIWIACLTDRQGNRIVTDWTGYAGAGSVDLWTNTMGRQVLDLREGKNNLWVPKDSKRAKEAKKTNKV